jgi:fluoride exporter
MKTFVEYMAVGAFGFFGSMLRLLVTRVSIWAFGAGFPVGTMIINLTGSLFLGWFMAMADSRILLTPALKLAIGVGFVGAYTTFSTFCFESNKLLQGGAFYQFAFNVIGSVVLGLLAVRLGMLLAGR